MATASQTREGRTAAARAGGRSEATRQRVAQAVLHFLGEGRFDFELQEVARMAGIHRTTLFRRWPDRDALVADALAEHVSGFSMEWTGDWQEDLRRIAHAMRDFLQNPVEKALNRIQATSRNREFREQMLRYWTPIVRALEAPIAEARDRGEISAEVDPAHVVWGLISPIIVTATFMQAPATDEFLNGIVDQTIRACRA